MSWFDVTPNDRAVLDPLVTDDDNIPEWEKQELWKGRKILHWPGNAELKVVDEGNDGTPDDALQNHLGWLVFSPRLCASVSEAGLSGFQFLPVKIRRARGPTLDGFQVANIIDVREALERSRSDFDVFPDDYFLRERRGRIRALRRTVLCHLPVDTDVFRLAEYPVRVFVSHRFVEVFDGLQCSGLSFAQVAT